MVEARTLTMVLKSMAPSRLPRLQRRDRLEEAHERRTEHVLERAGEEDDEALDDDDHVAGDRRHVEGELRAALVEHAEKDRGEHDADRMGAPHQRHRDADEAGAGSELDVE